MALIAGYVAMRPHCVEGIREEVRAFSILPGDADHDYSHCVVATLTGHLILKNKSTYPIRPQIASDSAGNVLVTLGIVWTLGARALLPRAVATAGRSLEACEGEFVAVFIEGATGVAHIVNDRFGSRPLYFLRGADATYFSSNVNFLLALARAPYRPDVVGWLEVCTSGHTLGTRTTTEGVQRLRPATHLTLSPGGAMERQYWQLEHQPDPGLDPVAHSAEVFTAFRCGVERRARLVEGGVLALSGGLDSRLVAGTLPPDAHYSAFTVVNSPGATATAETRAAAQVCTALGLPHRIEALPTPCSPARDVIALTGGMRSFQHMAIVMAYIDEIRRCGTRFLMGGGPGDVLAGSYIPSPAYLDPARTAECMQDALQRRLANSRGRALIFRDDVIEGSGAIADQALKDSLAAVTGPTAAHRITAWAMSYRQPAFTFTSVLHTHPDVSEAFSHLDYRYVDLMLRLPASWLYKRAFYAYMIHVELPQMRHIPYANTGQLLSGHPPPAEAVREPLWERSAGFVHGFGARVARRLLPQRAGEGCLPGTDRLLLEDVKEQVHSMPLLREILDLERCDRLLARTRAGACPSEEALGTLVSLCLSAATL